MINDIIYSPDYLVNSGGVIAIASEINKKEKLLEKKLIEIGDRLTQVILESKKNISLKDIEGGFVIIGDKQTLLKICNGFFLDLNAQGVCMIGKNK